MVTLSHSTGDDFYGRSTCSLIIGLARQNQGRLQDLFQNLWQSLILPSFNGAERPFVLFRLLNNGMGCAFANADMKLKANGKDMVVTLFLLDAGPQAIPVVVLYSGDLMLHFPVVEEFFRDLSVPGAPPGRSLFNAH